MIKRKNSKQRNHNNNNEEEDDDSFLKTIIEEEEEEVVTHISKKKLSSHPSKRSSASERGFDLRSSSSSPLYDKKLVGDRFKGRLEYENGSCYFGDLLKKEDGQIVCDGKGQYHDKIKNKTYKGSFLNDLKHGFGTTQYVDKIHKGNYERGLRHGAGVFVFSNGERYDGDFFRGEFHGQGKMVWNDGTSFMGSWKKGKMKFGVKKWNDNIYQGPFDEHGQPNGFGKTLFANGDFHRGFYQNGVFHGKGEFFDSYENSITYCMYSNGSMDEKNKFIKTYGNNKTLFLGGFDEINKQGNILFGRMDGEFNKEDSDAEEEGEDEVNQVQTRLGHFQYSNKWSEPILINGTYSTQTSQVTSQHFLKGPVVKEGTSAAWHDVETGNVRWAKLGMSGVGPIGRALFIYANGTGRIEMYQEEGALDRWVNMF